MLPVIAPLSRAVCGLSIAGGFSASSLACCNCFMVATMIMNLMLEVLEECHMSPAVGMLGSIGGRSILLFAFWITIWSINPPEAGYFCVLPGASGSALMQRWLPPC